MKIRAFAFLPVLLLSSACFATTCSVDIDSTDSMQFDKKSIVIPASCKNFTVNLKHSGKLNRSVMGHNWVLTETTDMKSVVADGVAAGLASGYVKPGDSRVIAATKVIGGGESDSLTFDISKLQANKEYNYFCSFPGHASMMNGKLTFAK